MTASICTKVNRNSIRELLEWLERETGSTFGNIRPTQHPSISRMTSIDYSPCGLGWMEPDEDDRQGCIWHQQNGYELVTPSTFKAAVKLACPKVVE